MKEIKILVEDEDFGFLYEMLCEDLMNNADGGWSIEEVDQ